ncbi:MAG: hypothetical protein ACM3NF_03630 [Gemmatimonadota bacterium]
MTGRARQSFIAGWHVRAAASVLLLLLSSVMSHAILARRAAGGDALRRDAAGAGGGGLLKEISRRPALALGFRNSLADLVWLEAVQISGERRLTRAAYDRLYHLVDSVIDFDPRFKVPYLLGGITLSDSPEHAGQAIGLMDRGRRVFPADWEFPFYTGYVRYFCLADPAGGGREFETAARLPGSPPYLPLLAARMLAEGGRPETALLLLEEMIKDETNPGRRWAIERRIREVTVERDLLVLERAAADYRGRTGTFPRRLDDLVAAGLLRRIPEEPFGGRYLIGPGGEIRSDRMAYRLKVFRRR